MFFTNSLSEKFLVFLIAVFFDLIFGEYPSKVHPVVYMGTFGKFFDEKFNKTTYSNRFRFLLGAFSLLLEVTMFSIIAYGIIYMSKHTEGILRTFALLLHFYILKSTFAIKSLYEHVSKCYVDDIELLRRNVSLIVSRDVKELDESHLYSAAIESLAENISDSITGPLFYYSLFGLPGAVIYRVVNTYDALFGYRNEKYEWFGKFSARFDDLLNIVPSRVTAFVISLFSPISSWKYILKYGAIKINAMYPMSAFAGVLKVGIEKIGYYKLEGKIPEKEDVKKALKLYKKVTAIILLIIITLTVVVK